MCSAGDHRIPDYKRAHAYARARATDALNDASRDNLPEKLTFLSITLNPHEVIFKHLTLMGDVFV